MKHLESTASRRLRNRLPQRLRDDVFAEAPTGELRGGPGSGSTRSHHEPRALPLRRQGGERPCDRLPTDPVTLEAPADGLVSVAPLGQRFRPAHRVALVVDQADPLQAVEGLFTQPGRESSALEPAVELGGRLLAARHRSKRGVHRAGAPQLSSQLPQPRALEDLPHAQPCPNDDVGRDRSPPCSVELDGDPTASQLAQPGDDRHYAGSLTFVGSLAFSGSATASASDSAWTGAAAPSVTGRSRADTT